MQYHGMLMLDSADETSWQRGAVRVEGDDVAVSVGQAQVGHWPLAQVAMTAEGAGRYWLTLNAGRILFAPDDVAAFEDEVRAHALRSRLGPAPSAPPNPTYGVARQPATTAGTVTAAPKSPGVAAVLSALWTGLGQIYNGEIMLGLLLMAVQFVNALLVFVGIGIITGLIVWIVSIVHAYRGAERYNRLHGLAA